MFGYGILFTFCLAIASLLHFLVINEANKTCIEPEVSIMIFILEYVTLGCAGGLLFKAVMG